MASFRSQIEKSFLGGESDFSSQEQEAEEGDDIIPPSGSPQALAPAKTATFAKFKMFALVPAHAKKKAINGEFVELEYFLADDISKILGGTTAARQARRESEMGRTARCENDHQLVSLAAGVQGFLGVSPPALQGFARDFCSQANGSAAI